MRFFWLIFSLSLSGSFGVRAQLQVGGTLPAPAMAVDVYDSYDGIDLVKELQGTITLIVIPDTHYALKEQYDSILKTVWTLTPYRVCRYSDLDSYPDSGVYSYFLINVETFTINIGFVPATSRFLTYDLCTKNFNKRNKFTGYTYYARLILPEESQLKPLLKGLTSAPYTLGQATTLKDNWQTLYASGAFEYLQPAFIKQIFSTTNDFINRRDVFPMNKRFVNNTLIGGLNRDTLYIQNNVYDALMIKKNRIGDFYPYPIQAVPTEALSHLILNHPEGVYYLTLTTQDQGALGQDKHVNIYHSRKGPVYGIHKGDSKELEYRDLKEIAAKIKSSL